MSSSESAEQNSETRGPETRESWTPVSRVPVWLVAILFGAVIVLIGAGLDYFLGARHRSYWGSIRISEVVTAVVAALLFYRVMWYERERRRTILRRLRIIAEMNHHIRNAVHVISLSTHTTTDQQTVKVIQEALKRIDWALKEILPKL